MSLALHYWIRGAHLTTEPLLILFLCSAQIKTHTGTFAPFNQRRIQRLWQGGGADTGSLGMEVTQRGPGAEPLVEVRGNPPPKMGVWAEVWGWLFDSWSCLILHVHARFKKGKKIKIMKSGGGDRPRGSVMHFSVWGSDTATCYARLYEAWEHVWAGF